jgi:fused signal recognition particle receptor
MDKIISRWRNGLAKTSKSAFGRMASLVGATEISKDTWDELEMNLIQGDLGVEVASEIIRTIQDIVRNTGLIRTEQLRDALKLELLNRLDKPPRIELSGHPSVILMVGINGSGKTTTIAKLSRQYLEDGKTVLIGAADTFRAAAADQLQEWGSRLGVEVIAGPPDSDPGAVAYNTIQAGIARKADMVLIDTAGRLHTKYNLMEELKKIHRVIGKALEGAPHAVWLVLDATTGQNALHQARAFKDSVGVTGVILAKLDSSAKGGMAFAVQRDLGLPILYVGLGERPEDLQVFDPEAFIAGLLSFEQ